MVCCDVEISNLGNKVCPILTRSFFRVTVSAHLGKTWSLHEWLLFGFVLAREILDKSGKPIQFLLDVVSSLVILREPVPNISVLSVLIGAETYRVLNIIQRSQNKQCSPCGFHYQCS